MTVGELLRQLEELAASYDPEALAAGSYEPEAAHVAADELLLSYINDAAVSDAFHAIMKWYA